MLHPLSSTPHPRVPAPAHCRPRTLLKTRAVALAALAVLDPAPACGAMGLRGDAGDGGTPVRRQHRGRGLAADGAPPVMANWALTVLGPSSSRDRGSPGVPPEVADRGTTVTIQRFTTDLLAPDFPYPLRYQTERELSGAVSLYVASYLEEALDAPVRNLGLDCKNNEAPAGPERRRVLACTGSAVFGEAPRARSTRPMEVNEAVRRAFEGEARGDFLKAMYPRYEMAHEKKEWDVERGRRSKEKEEEKGEKKKKKTHDKKKNSRKKKKKEKKKEQKKKEKREKKKEKKKPQKNKKPQDKPKSGGAELNVFGYVTGAPYNDKNIRITGGEAPPVAEEGEVPEPEGPEAVAEGQEGVPEGQEEVPVRGRRP